MRIRGKTISATTLALLCIIAVLGSATAYLWVTRYLDFQVTIKTGPDFKFYEDETCTTELPNFHFGEIMANGTIDQIIYIKNTGNCSLMIRWQLNEKINETEGWWFSLIDEFYGYYSDDKLRMKFFMQKDNNETWFPLEISLPLDMLTLELAYDEVKEIHLQLQVLPETPDMTVTWQLCFIGIHF